MNSAKLTCVFVAALSMNLSIAGKVMKKYPGFQAFAALACGIGPSVDLAAFRYAGLGFAGCFAKICVSRSLLSYGLLSFDKNQVGGWGTERPTWDQKVKSLISQTKTCVRWLSSLFAALRKT